MAQTNLIENVFVSVCLTTQDYDESLLGDLKALSELLAGTYRYWEILIVVDSRQARDLDALLNAVPNTRLLIVRSGTALYRARIVAVSDAIGDVILLSTPGEIASLDVLTMLKDANARDVIVVGRKTGVSLLSAGLKMLGRGAGFQVDERDLQSAAFPKAELTRVLQHDTPQLALRFPPVDAPVEYISVEKSALKSKRRLFGDFGRRMALIQKLLISTAPKVLSVTQILSLLVVLGTMGYVVFIFIVWLTFENVEPGWFTTSTFLSMTTFLVGMMAFSSSIALEKIIDSLAAGPADDVIGERNRIDLFDKVFSELNVEIDQDEPSASPDDKAVELPDEKRA